MKKNLKFACWNVNGIRACIRKGFWDWADADKSDFICLQETKIAEPDFIKLLEAEGLVPISANQPEPLVTEKSPTYAIFSSAKKPGYSGVAIFTKLRPQKIEFGIGKPEFDDEGRTIFLHYEDFILVTSYTPNAGRELDRLDYKLAYNDALLKKLQALRKKQPKIIMCGDLNVAHEEIDLKNPKTNTKNAGFTPPERDWFSKFLSKKYVDTFRHQNPGLEGQYTWWTYRMNARARNVGWRIDYFVTTEEALGNVQKASIQPSQHGSDHCPIHLTYKL